MYQPLLYDEMNFGKNIKLEVILGTPDDSDSGCFVEVGLKYPGNIKEKNMYFPFCRENKFSPENKFSD